MHNNSTVSTAVNLTFSDNVTPFMVSFILLCDGTYFIYSLHDRISLSILVWHGIIALLPSLHRCLPPNTTAPRHGIDPLKCQALKEDTPIYIYIYIYIYAWLLQPPTGMEKIHIYPFESQRRVFSTFDQNFDLKK